MASREGRPSRAGSSARGRQASQKKSFPLVPVLIGAVVLIGVVVGAVILLNDGGSSAAPAAVAPGGPVPTMETRNHTEDRVQYSTNPPTSGDHNPQAATQGVYSVAPADEQIVHNLEHGNIVMYYDPTKLDEATIEQFKEVVRDLNRSRANPCGILAPRENMPDGHPIALTSWGALAYLDSFDEAQIRAFWRDYVATGPELGMGNCG